MLLQVSISLLLFSVLNFGNTAPEAKNNSSEDAPPVQETLWQYVDEDVTYQLRFSSDGHLVTTHPNDVTPENDFWKQMGKDIEFTYNNSFSTYKGEMVNDGLIEGTASNGSFTWSWKAYRLDAI